MNEQNKDLEPKTNNKKSLRLTKKQSLIIAVIVLIILIASFYYYHSTAQSESNFSMPITQRHTPLAIDSREKSPNPKPQLPKKVASEVKKIPEASIKTTEPKDHLAQAYLQVQNQIFEQKLKNELLKTQIQTKMLQGSLNNTQNIVVGAVFKFNNLWQAMLSIQGKTIQVHTGENFKIPTSHITYHVDSISKGLVKLTDSNNQHLALHI